MASKRKPYDNPGSRTPGIVPYTTNSTPRSKRQKADRGAGKPTHRPRTPLQTPNRHLLLNRPWLNTPQTVSAQDLFIIQSRDNLTPGSTGPKDWTEVAREFNERFRDDLKKPLAPATMSRRCGVARKDFLRDNPEYEEARKYPIPDNLEEEEEDNDDDEDEYQTEDDEQQQEEMDSDGWTMDPMDPDIDAYYNCNPRAPFYHYPDPRFDPPPNPSLLLANTPTTPQFTPGKPPTSTHPHIPGSYNPSAIHSTSIPPLTRIKFHLRHRTSEPVTFHFSSPDQNNLGESSQYVDANLLVATSSVYATQARVDPEDTAIFVPAPFTARTVNIFIQLISPEPALELPTHFLWKARKGVPGIYDRFGGIAVEKIEWSEETLVDLLFFAREMGVTWILDMVVDRLFFLFDRECKNKAAFKDMGQPVNGHVNVRGRKVFVGYKLPAVDAPLPTLSVDDFWAEVLHSLVAGTKGLDVPTLSFVGDLIKGLHLEVDPIWLAGTQPRVQDLLSRSSDEYLRPMARHLFCARYHHHLHTSLRYTQPCYTQHRVQSAEYYINALYAMETLQEMVKLSDGLPMANSLASIMYPQNGDASKLRKDDSSAEMLEAEKMVLAMECRLKEAKAALWTARSADEEEKLNAVHEATRFVRALSGIGGT
ncbi:hypothetical protein PTNB73_05342 [Pyrenophora teres f. teres]|nr:hypothetical protein PTNB85_04361 [Pyrenophora teres f. teres]KAE8867248.1 hypothetical protein PTNB73_05342 [Pyrenophora teres f. teres]